MIKWTNEMIEELRGVKSFKEFANKYGMSQNTARNKKSELFNTTKKEVKLVVEKEEVKLEEKLGEVNASNISIIPSVILNIDGLIDKGVQFYITDVIKEISKLDKMLSDINHTIENSVETMDMETKLTLIENVAKISRKRRLFKNEHEFLDNHRIECSHFIKFIKEVRTYSLRVCDKKYSTRVLKEELGSVQITNENNSELVYLRGKVAELESKQNPTDRKVIDRLLVLEKANIKQFRKSQREAGHTPPLDKLELNWKDMFLKKLDKETQKGILDDCRKMYDNNPASIDVEEIREWCIMHDILPKKLVELNYFTKK